MWTKMKWTSRGRDEDDKENMMKFYVDRKSFSQLSPATYFILFIKNKHTHTHKLPYAFNKSMTSTSNEMEYMEAFWA